MFCQALLPAGHSFAYVKYFTARVKKTSHDPHGAAHQAIYLKALTAHIPASELFIIYGHYQSKPALAHTLSGNSVQIMKTEEKGSDVNLAIHLVNDAWHDRYDCGVVVSNDSDLAEAMRIAGERGKRLGLVTPKKRIPRNRQHPEQERYTSKRLAKHADFLRETWSSALRRSQLPNPVPETKIHKPPTW